MFTGTEILGPEVMLVTDETGIVEELVWADDADAEFIEGILCPGLVNAHCHLELSHLKGRIAKHTGLVEFVQEVMKIRDTGHLEKQKAMQDAHGEMLMGGIVAVGDICNTADSTPIKAGSELFWKNFVEVSGFVDATARKRIDEVEEVRKKFDGAYIVPHSPYSVSKSLFTLIAAKKEAVVSIHNQESPEEDRLYENRSGGFLQLYENLGIDISSFYATGKSSFRSWLPYFSKGQRILSVHNTFINADDIEMAEQSGKHIWFCLCPHANLYIENSLPPVELLRNAGCKIVLGTDSYASNDSLSIAGEMHLLQRNFHLIPLVEILTWATVNGAAALGLGGLGRFSPGTKPGLVQLELTSDGMLTGKATRLL